MTTVAPFQYPMQLPQMQQQPNLWGIAPRDFGPGLFGNFQPTEENPKRTVKHRDLSHKRQKEAKERLKQRRTQRLEQSRPTENESIQQLVYDLVQNLPPDFSRKRKTDSELQLEADTDIQGTKRTKVTSCQTITLSEYSLIYNSINELLEYLGTNAQEFDTFKHSRACGISSGGQVGGGWFGFDRFDLACIPLAGAFAYFTQKITSGAMSYEQIARWAATLTEFMQYGLLRDIGLSKFNLQERVAERAQELYNAGSIFSCSSALGCNVESYIPQAQTEISNSYFGVAYSIAQDVTHTITQHDILRTGIGVAAGVTAGYVGYKLMRYFANIRKLNEKRIADAKEGNEKTREWMNDLLKESKSIKEQQIKSVQLKQMAHLQDLLDFLVKGHNAITVERSELLLDAFGLFLSDNVELSADFIAIIEKYKTDVVKKTTQGSDDDQKILMGKIGDLMKPENRYKDPGNLYYIPPEEPEDPQEPQLGESMEIEDQ